MRVPYALLIFFLVNVSSQDRYDSGLPDHYPKYLKQGKYGQAFATQGGLPPQWKPNVGAARKGGTKTSFKSSYGGAPPLAGFPGFGGLNIQGSLGQPAPQLPQGGSGCKENPRPPLNSELRCTLYSGCRATCLPKYQFPNGETQLFITCQDGEWRIEHTEWDTIPACEPICLPQCQNNGICVSPNQCHCSETFTGPQCQFEKKPCLNYPPLPLNSRRTCSSTSCTISCLKGHEFPDGSAIANMQCRDGQWAPTRNDWARLPDCAATCTPKCLNGGNCLSFNVCQCPQEFRGAQCQYRAEVCNAKKLQFNGGYNCSGDAEGFSCSITCPAGIQFQFPPSPVYKCTYQSGIFYPQPIPQCIFGTSVDVIPLEGSSGSFYNSIGTNAYGSQYPGGQIPMEIPDLMSGSSTWNKPSLVGSAWSGKKGSKAGRILQLSNSTNYESIIKGYYGMKEGQNVVVDQKLPKPGSCFTWGAAHYKTFDGRVYSFESPCAHTLVKDSVDNTFNVIVQNSPNCYKGAKCHRIIKIFIQDREYTLTRSDKDVPMLTSGKKHLPIPSQAPGLRAELAAHHIVLSLDSVGASIRWDGKQLVQVIVSEGLWNRTSGLCGNIDGSTDDDLTAKDGIKPKSLLTFATSWQVDSLGTQQCNTKPKDIHTCASGVQSAKATEFCQKLLTDKRFAVCHTSVPIATVLEACRWDYCACADENPALCACQTVDMYVRECRHRGVKKMQDWRDENMCPIQCTGGRTYKPCGPLRGSQAYCGASSDEQSSTTDPATCEEGCYCPSNTVLHEGSCIDPITCPCRLRGKSFSPGAQVAKDCNTCTCEGGSWVCTQVACGARCSAVGDPHYQTFDGKKFDFMGQCSYVLVKTEDYVVEAENVACSGSISQTMNFPVSVAVGLPSCTKTVTIRMPEAKVIKLKQNREVLVNGQEVVELPYDIDGATIRVASSLFIVVEFMDGLEIWWDGMTRAYVDVPASYKGTTKGLCGTFNANQNDDFLTPEGDVEKGVIPFANKWKTTETCKDIPDVQKSHPCDINVHNKAAAEKHCAKIKSDLFANCHWYVDPEIYYLDCLYDMCSCEAKVSDCLCPILSSYAKECADKGVILEWRSEVRECGIHCPAGQQFKTCGNSCARSCLDIALKPNCRQTCVEGCNCPEGATLDEHGECVPVGTCPCRQEGLEFPPGYKEIRPASKGQQLCICSNAQWDCREALSEEILKFPQSSDLKAVCSSTRNQEFTTCEPAEPKSCRNMHTHQPTSPAICRPGCRCKPGYVLDAFSKECVMPETCPCHHGGRSYQDGNTIQSDCNTCKCEKGKWKCTTRDCSAQCSAWGDSHYRTFDGRMFDYQGQCDYVLAKGALNKDENFDITIQNVPCSTLGLSCSKSVTIKIGGESLTLTHGKPLPSHSSFKHMSVRATPQMVIVESADLGLVVHWDRGTRVYVRLDPRWKERVKGLCGNYNGDQMDDFQTPSGGISEVSSQLFGDSWKLQSYCPEAVQVTDTCEQRPDRKTWAVKRCGLLKSPLFEACHSEVEVGPWLERCVFDTCACDQGGDCECLCTALAAYAYECNVKGVPVKWRSQDLCPMQCDETCSNYAPCISTCPLETCDNLLVSNQLGALCAEDTCVEGCQPKVCPPGHVYSNASGAECVPKATCPKPLCLDVPGVGVFYEGDLMEEDSCHKCYCSMRKKSCQGVPCSSAVMESTTELITHQHEQLVKCSDGWTSWVNQDKQRAAAKGKAAGQPTDSEPLPSPLLLNSLPGAKCNEGEMIDIECRTVDSHLDAKSTGLDVECSLERGLVCTATPGKGQKMCPDFEIRVLCECTPPTTLEPMGPCDPTEPNKEHPTDCHAFYHCVPGILGPELVEKSCGADMMYNPETQVCDWPATVLTLKPHCGFTTEQPIEEIIEAVNEPLCPPGQEFSHCSVECERLCLHYGFIVREKGKCALGQVCEQGCVSAERRTSCPPGMLWRDEDTCVQLADCSCRSHEGKTVKPGTVFQESECEICQCIDNHYVCDKSACAQVLTTPAPKEQVELFTHMLVKSTVSPPNLCDEDLYIDLIEGDIPLSDQAFSASSSLTPAFAPSAARFSSKVTDKSSGSWSPAESNKKQYLQVILPEIEPIYGLIMKGSPLYDQYVTSYHVLHSMDGMRFDYITDKDNPEVPKLFRGNIEAKQPMKEMLDEPIETKIIRISPQSWHDSIAIQLEIIGCGELTTTASSRTTIKPICEDPMGVENQMMGDQQIKVSSEKMPDHSKKRLKINGVGAWQPLTNSPTEWIQFDFLEPRNVTGVETKGGPNGWVSAYNVKYSHDKNSWNPILDDYSNEKMFLGNFDHDTPNTNYFNRPVQTRYLRVEPKKWKDNIQMKIEPHGCFKPYPITSFKKSLQFKSPIISKCNTCPGVQTSTSDFNVCKCDDGLWWDGEHCVNRAQCPCMVGHIPYAVGTVYEEDDCSQCLCKLGGVSQCRKKQCDKCPNGLRSVLTVTCGCVCKPCPDGQLLCPTSDICISEELWCNGVQDCPDDETNCPTTKPPVETTIESIIKTTKIAEVSSEIRKCPEVKCPAGYKVELKKSTRTEKLHQNLSPMFYMYTGRKSSSKGGFSKGGFSKGGRLKTTLPRQPVQEMVIDQMEEKEPKCQEFRCVALWKPPTFGSAGTKPCPVAKCPPGYKVIYEPGDMNNPEVCRRYECKPPPPKDATCNVTGRTFNTFDGIEYKYDICDHVLARDLEFDDWDLVLMKDCKDNDLACTRKLVVRHADELVTLLPDLSVEFNGYRYTVQQTKKIGAKNKSFVVSRLGDTLLFVSNHYGFWVLWDKLGNVKVGLSTKLIGKVDGLCGYYNNLGFDDKRKPDGKQARTTAEFGDSWSIGEKTCEVRSCPIHVQSKAWQMCNKVKDHTLAACHGTIDLDAFVSRCLETACECLEGTVKKGVTEDWCRCQIIEAFVVECLIGDHDVELSDWRVQHECPAECPAPLVHHDCYRRRCEPSCSNLAEMDPCPVAPNMCFPGCYCPPGTVRKHSACVPARQCRDCECNVLPNLKYQQFDGTNVTVDTNCSYIMVRDKVVTKGKKHDFQVVVTNAPCAQNPGKMCPDIITLMYNTHVITIQRSPDVKKLIVAQDDAEIMHLPFETDDWLEVEERAAKHINILLPKIQLELTVYFPTLGASVKLPSHTYSSRIEGLCGNCNRNNTDDLLKKDGSEPATNEEFTHSWLFGDAEECYAEKIKECKDIEDDPCLELLNVERFGQCHMLLSPAIFLETCRRDICGGILEPSCISLQTYAAGCAANGLCVDWHIGLCPARKCPADQHYKLCGSACAPTCENYKTANKKPCPPIPTEGCFCPEGLVMRNDSCVASRLCETCDKEGHHPGDKWTVDSCTNCECDLKSAQVRCQTQQCPALETVCEQGYTTLKLEAAEEECCPKYLCVPAATVSPTCEAPQKLSCGHGQVMKLDLTPDGCQKFVCQCKPLDECEIIEEISPEELLPGMERVIDKSGCCPIAEMVCKPENCPEAKQCPKFYDLKKKKAHGDCCFTYSCEPPKDKCVYEMKFTAAAKGGERPKTQHERETIAKKPNESWQDGPCRECKCVKKEGHDGYDPICSVSECPALLDHSDKDEYDLQEEPVMNQCCPNVRRVKCKHLGKLYKIGAAWKLDNDPCSTVECLETPSGIQKQMKIKTCDTTCELGSKYEPPALDSNNCCGSCKTIACVVDGKIREIGQTWSSEDHCTKYECVNLNGSIQVQSQVVNCPKISEELQNEFVYEYVPKIGECCGIFKQKACKVEGKVYKVGDTWASPDGDKCKNVSCVQSHSGEIAKQKLLKSCNTDCAKGWEYRPAAKDSPQCCGECFPVACVVNGTLKNPHDTWMSKDGCISYECDWQGTQLAVSSSQKSCPKLDDCPAEDIWFDGCCKQCNMTARSQSTCVPTEIPPQKSIGLIKFLRVPHGQCWNGAVIKGFTECVGQCYSATKYVPKSGTHESVCNCCQATKFTSLNIEMQCEDGHRFKKVVAVPSQCSCEGCSAPAKATKGGTKH